MIPKTTYRLLTTGIINPKKAKSIKTDLFFIIANHDKKAKPDVYKRQVLQELHI